MPATGKSTLMRRILEEIGKGIPQKAGLLHYTLHESSRVIVLGQYNKGGNYPGTDCLSMAVLPEAVGNVQVWSGMKGLEGWTVAFEGDRLYAGKFMTLAEKARKIQCKWIQLTVSDASRKSRMCSRDDTKTDSWLRGRETKLRGIAERHEVQRVVHETSTDTESACSLILTMMSEFSEAKEERK